MTPDEYALHDATDLAALVRDGDVSPGELLDAAIDQIQARNPAINAVIHTMYDEARATIAAGLPDGAFTGVPFLLKDLGAQYKGVPTTSGSRLFRDTVPDHDSNLVSRYRAAGLVICGKTNTPELGLATTTEPVLHGPTRNPTDLAYSAGGSSGGAAAAVQAGFVPMAHASDGGGSIRIPASACGVFGLKPTRARTPMGPDIGEGWNGSSISHAVTATVRDSAALLDATAGEDLGAPYAAPHQQRPYVDEVGADPGRLRIALVTGAFNRAPVDAACASAAHQSASLAESLGHHIEEAQPDFDGEALAEAHASIVFANIANLLDSAGIAQGTAVTLDDVERVTLANATLGRNISAAEYIRSVQTLHRVGREFAAFLSNFDVMLTPTMACQTPRLGMLNMNGEDADAYAALINRTIGFTSLFNNTGCPAMSLPLVTGSNGLPIGIQFGASFGREDLLFRLAAQLESACPWHTEHRSDHG